MRYFILATILLSLSTSILCQSRRIPVSVLYQQQVGGVQIREDSIVKIYGTPLFEVSRFYIRVDKAFVNQDAKELRMIGKVCYYDKEKTCVGLPNVGIFKAQKSQDNLLKNITTVSTSSFVQDSMNKNGFFDIKLRINKGESLFFYMPHFYLEEFKLDKLIGNNPVVKKKKLAHS